MFVFCVLCCLFFCFVIPLFVKATRGNAPQTGFNGGRTGISTPWINQTLYSIERPLWHTESCASIGAFFRWSETSIVVTEWCVPNRPYIYFQRTPGLGHSMHASKRGGSKHIPGDLETFHPKRFPSSVFPHSRPFARFARCVAIAAAIVYTALKLPLDQLKLQLAFNGAIDLRTIRGLIGFGLDKCSWVENIKTILDHVAQLRPDSPAPPPTPESRPHRPRSPRRLVTSNVVQPASGHDGRQLSAATAVSLAPGHSVPPASFGPPRPTAPGVAVPPPIAM